MTSWWRFRKTTPADYAALDRAADKVITSTIELRTALLGFLDQMKNDRRRLEADIQALARRVHPDVSLPKEVSSMKVSQAGLDLIAEFEGCVLTAYPDPATGGEPWTIGYGHTHGVVPGMTITKQDALDLLAEDISWVQMAIDRNVTVQLQQCQYDALASFTYNLGAGSLAQSTLLRMLNAGKSAAEVGPQFDRWVNGPNGPMLGLIRRRAAERAMFEGRPL